MGDTVGPDAAHPRERPRRLNVNKDSTQRTLVHLHSNKGLFGQPLPFDKYAARMREEARSEYRRWLQQHRSWRQSSLWAS